MAKKKDSTGNDLADEALDGSADKDLEKAIAELSPEEAEMFVRALELAIKKRRVLLFGYLSALVAIIGGMVWALYFYGSRESGTFVGWVFLLPILAAGLLFMFFGRLSRSIKK